MFLGEWRKGMCWWWWERPPPPTPTPPATSPPHRSSTANSFLCNTLNPPMAPQQLTTGSLFPLPSLYGGRKAQRGLTFPHWTPCCHDQNYVPITPRNNRCYRRLNPPSNMTLRNKIQDLLRNAPRSYRYDPKLQEDTAYYRIVKMKNIVYPIVYRKLSTRDSSK